MPTATRSLPSRAPSGFFNLAALEHTFDNYYDDLLSPVPPGTCPPLSAPAADRAVQPPSRPELDVDAIRLGCLTLLDRSSGLKTASQRQLSCILEYHALFASAALAPPGCPGPSPDHTEANDGGDCDVVATARPATDHNNNNPRVPTAGLVSAARAELGPIFGGGLGADAPGAAVSELLLSPAGITRCVGDEGARVIFVAFFQLLLFGLLGTGRPEPATADQIAREFEVSQHSLITLSGARPASR